MGPISVLIDFVYRETLQWARTNTLVLAKCYILTPYHPVKHPPLVRTKLPDPPMGIPNPQLKLLLDHLPVHRHLHPYVPKQTTCGAQLAVAESREAVVGMGMRRQVGMRRKWKSSGRACSVLVDLQRVGIPAGGQVDGVEVEVEERPGASNTITEREAKPFMDPERRILQDFGGLLVVKNGV